MTFHEWLTDAYGDELLHDTLALREWLDMAETVLDLPLFDEPRTLDAAAARRIVFQYPNGWNITWLHTPTPHLTLWNTQPDTPLPRSLHDTFPHQHTPHARIYTPTPSHARPHDIDTIHDLLTTASRAFGTPTRICLPWDNTPTPPGILDLLDTWRGETFPDTLHTLTNTPPRLIADILSDADEWDSDPASLLAFALLSSGTSPTPDEWTPRATLHTCAGLACLPHNAAPLRLHAFLHELETDHGWIVLRNQCCGRCQQDTIDEEIHARNLTTNTPILTLWADASGSIIGPDGSIHLTLHEPATPHDSEQLRAVASTHHLTTTDMGDGRIHIHAEN